PDEVMALLKEVAMGVRNDPAYKDVFLADPTLLGVDAIKGSQVIYPVQLRTKANQQWAAMRETQRRIRLALEEHGMLPGDPMRVYRKGSGQRTADSGQEQDAVRIEESRAVEKVDPTTIKPHEGNPFEG
ncbi:MAG TPA: mechanosensitive ion channel family protein, partial [Acidobacteriaceae bacterium]|nr:mechanosensitive ion channel family protein [Acidobacteriaceae bacterium]